MSSSINRLTKKISSHRLAKKVSSIFKKEEPAPTIAPWYPTIELPRLPFHPIFDVSTKGLRAIKIEELEYQLECIQYHENLLSYLCDYYEIFPDDDDELPLPIKWDYKRQEKPQHTLVENLAARLRNNQT